MKPLQVKPTNSANKQLEFNKNTTYNYFAF